MKDKEVNAHLHSANIILLLISSDFLASDDCYENEMIPAIERHQTRQAYAIPILIRPVDWVPPCCFEQILPNAKPITLWQNCDEAFTNIARAIRKVVDELH